MLFYTVDSYYLVDILQFWQLNSIQTKTVSSTDIVMYVKTAMFRC